MKLFYRLLQSQGPRALAALLLLTCLTAQAQFKPGEVTLAGEKYYEYPYRIDELSDEIPPCGYNLPNGKYVVYASYHFKTINKQGDRKLIAKDTSIISALFTLENNKPSGTAYFYNCKLRAGASKKKLDKWYSSGNYTDGLKDGEWIAKYRSTAYLSHYKAGLKHGAFTEWAGKGKTYNTCFIDDKYAGYVNTYGRKGRLMHRYYYDTLHVHDSTFSYNYDGKLYYATDMVKNAPARTKGGIWKSVFEKAGYSYRGGIRGNTAFTFFRNYDHLGRLETDVKFKYADSYYFDSILVNSYRITIKMIGCPDGNKNDTCYEVVNRNILHANDKRIDHYRNDDLYKTIIITPDPKKGADTAISFTFKVDSSRLWQFQPTYIFKSGKYSRTTYQLPAINYSYFVESDGIRTRSSSFGGYFWFKTKLSIDPKYKPSYSHIPARIDSVNNLVVFTDTVTDKKTGIGFISSTYRRAYRFIINPHEEVNPNSNYDPQEIDFDNEYLLDNEIHRPASDLYNNAYDLNFEMDPYTICSSDMGYVNPYYNFFGATACPPELMLRGNAPYSGLAFIHKGKAVNYNPQKSLLSLGSYFINYDYTFNAKGMYKEGLKDGVWEFLAQKGGLSASADLKNVFFKNKKHVFYSTATYSQGQLNGPKNTYLRFVPEIWDEGYFYFKGQPVKYLDNTLNYAYGVLDGPAVYYHPNNKVKCNFTYKEGMMEGEVLKYNFNGGLIYRGDFKDDQLHGAVTTYDYVSLKPVVKAYFTNGRLNGLLEMMNDGDKWLEVKADTGYLLYKKLFYEKDLLKEEILLDAGPAYRLRPILLQSGNFLSYSPGIIKKAKTRYRYERSGRKPSISDSLNNLKFYGSYKSFYNTGQLYCKGRIEKMRPAGDWEFYDIAGTLINKITFKDSVFAFSDTSQKIMGKLTGYYGNGKIRCRAYVTALDVSYDCNTHADLSAFELILADNYDYYGKDNCTNGTGLVKQYNESGVLQAQGRLENYMKTGLWKYYDPNGKLNKTGVYANNLEEGTWLTGDLEGFNYEDAACFDRSNEEDMKKFLYNQKNLKVTKAIYKKGELIRDDEFYIDMNKE